MERLSSHPYRDAYREPEPRRYVGIVVPLLMVVLGFAVSKVFFARVPHTEFAARANDGISAVSACFRTCRDREGCLLCTTQVVESVLKTMKAVR